jgi:predicted transcriptional regulator
MKNDVSDFIDKRRKGKLKKFYLALLLSRFIYMALMQNIVINSGGVLNHSGIINKTAADGAGIA